MSINNIGGVVLVARVIRPPATCCLRLSIVDPALPLAPDDFLAAARFDRAGAEHEGSPESLVLAGRYGDAHQLSGDDHVHSLNCDQLSPSYER